MATKKVLDVGQCDLDNSLISDMLTTNFDVVVDRVKTRDQAFDAVKNTAYDLVLINRLLDIDRSEGADVLADIKNDESTARTKVMIVSNFEDAQRTAVAAGAEAGFGKSALNVPATIDLLNQYLR
jgi:DNA-binding NarL/FixJ family response regulator